VDYSLNRLYGSLGISKQAFHEWLDRWLSESDEFEQLLPVIRQIRQEHPAMSAKVMYELVNPQTMGRDKFVRVCRDHGFNVQVKRNKARTTDSRGVNRFPNRIKDLSITSVNQVWVSDITYYRIGSRFSYITFIMDLHSRFIVGYNVSSNLKTENTTIPALQQALKKYSPKTGLILHSDGGGQYYCRSFTELTAQYGILNSMTWENGENNHAERINGTIKNQYLSGYRPTNFNQLQRSTDRAVYNYNFNKPHESLRKRTPSDCYTVFHKTGTC
jgi:transposase InsO family protein